MAIAKRGFYAIGQGRYQFIAAGQEIPSWAEMPTNPAIVGDDAPKPPEDNTPVTPGRKEKPKQPPISGKGSSVTAWKDYASALGVDYPDDADRDDLIALVKESGYEVN